MKIKWQSRVFGIILFTFIFTALDYFRRTVIGISSSLFLNRLPDLILNLDTRCSLKQTKREPQHMLLPNAEIRMWNIHSFTPRGSIIGAVTRLWATLTRYSLSTPTGGKRLISSPNRLALGLAQRTIQGIRGTVFPEVKQLAYEADHLPPVLPKLRLSGAIIPIFHMPSMCHQEQRYLTHIYH
jgi:hypothetical protein